MSRTVHLAIDLGAGSGRAIVGLLDEERLELCEVHRFPNEIQRGAGGLHWNVEALERGIAEGITRATALCAECGVDLTSIGVDTWGVDYALLDAKGELIGAPFSYRDDRAASAFERAVSRVGRDRLYAATGTQLMPINTLFQLLAHAETDPVGLDRAERLVFMPDLFHHLLSGDAPIERSIASTSQMLDARTGTWARPLLEELGIPTRLLGEPIPSGTPVGPLRSELAARVGAPDGVHVVAPAGHDTACAVAAVPAKPDSSWCFLSSGTWSLLGAELEAPHIDDAAREAPFTNELGVAGTVRFLQNINGLWLVEECRRDLAARRRTFEHDELAELAEAAPPLRTLVDPAHPPLALPGHMPEKIAAYARATSQPVPEDPGALVRCCLESLALAYRRTLEQLETILERRFDVVHVVGGGGRNRLLNRLTADALRRCVVVGPAEATAAGNVLIQALGLGLVEDAAALRAIVARSVDPETYEPDAGAAWDDAYGRFLEACAAAGAAESES